MSREIYLQMTYRRGKPLAGYVCLPREDGDCVARSHRASEGLVVDYAADGRPIGIEILSPSLVSIDAINKLLADLHCSNMTEAELAPLLIA